MSPRLSRDQRRAQEILGVVGPGESRKADGGPYPCMRCGGERTWGTALLCDHCRDTLLLELVATLLPPERRR